MDGISKSLGKDQLTKNLKKKVLNHVDDRENNLKIISHAYHHLQREEYVSKLSG